MDYPPSYYIARLGGFFSRGSTRTEVQGIPHLRSTQGQGQGQAIHSCVWTKEANMPVSGNPLAEKSAYRQRAFQCG